MKIIVSAVLASTLLLLTACNTVKGVGQDIQKAGEKIAIYNQEAGRIEDDEIYDDFTAFLNDLYDLLGIGG